MTAQATATAALAVVALTLLVLYVWLWHAAGRDRRTHAEGLERAYRYGDERVAAVLQRAEGLQDELNDARRELNRARADLALATTKLEAADRRLEDLELELARRRAGAV